MSGGACPSCANSSTGSSNSVSPDLGVCLNSLCEEEEEKEVGGVGNGSGGGDNIAELAEDGDC